MTLEYRYHSDWNCVLIRALGTRYIAEYRALAETLKADSRVPPQYLRFGDMREAIADSSPDFARQVAAVMDGLEKVKPVGRGVILAKEKLLFGLVRLYQASRHDPEDRVRVFDTVARAYDWLGLPAETPDPFAAEVWVADKVFEGR